MRKPKLKIECLRGSKFLLEIGWRETNDSEKLGDTKSGCRHVQISIEN